MVDLRTQIEDKHAEAVKQLAGWREQLRTAATQAERWDAVRQVCEELLADAGPDLRTAKAETNPYKPPRTEIEEAPPFA